MLHAHIEALRNQASTEKRLPSQAESVHINKQQKLNDKEIIALLDEIDALEYEPYDEQPQSLTSANIQALSGDVPRPVQNVVPLQTNVIGNFDLISDDFLQGSLDGDNLYVPKFTASNNPQPRVVDMILAMSLEQPMHRHLFAPTLLSHNLTNISCKYPLVPLKNLISGFPKDKRIVKSPQGIPFALMVQSQKVVFYDTLCTLTDNDTTIQATISRTVTEALTSTTKLVFGTVLVLCDASFVNHSEWHMCVVRRNVLAVYHNVH